MALRDLLNEEEEEKKIDTSKSRTSGLQSLIEKASSLPKEVAPTKKESNIFTNPEKPYQVKEEKYPSSKIQPVKKTAEELFTQPKNPYSIENAQPISAFDKMKEASLAKYNSLSYQDIKKMKPSELVDLRIKAGLDKGTSQEWSSSFMAGVGDLMSTLGTAANLIDQKGGIISKAGEKLKEAGEITKSQRTDFKAQSELGEFDFGDLKNPDWWTNNVPRMVPFTMSLIPLSIVGGEVGVGIAARVGLGALGQAIVGSTVAAGLSRPAESLMEAANAFDSAKEKGFDDAKAREVANEVFMENIKQLSVLDIVQMLPFIKNIKGLNFAKNPILDKVLGTAGMVAGVGSEGVEEVLQNRIVNMAMGDKFDMLSPENKESFILGMVSGGIFQGVGSIQQVIVDKLPPKEKEIYQENYDKFVSEEKSSSDSMSLALNEVGKESPEVLKTATQETIKEKAEEIGQLDSDFTTIRDEIKTDQAIISSNPDNMEVLNKIGELQSKLNTYEEAVKKTAVKITDTIQGNADTTIDTVQYPDGKFASKIDSSISKVGINTDFSQSKLYNTEDEAIKAANEELLSWAEESLQKENITTEDSLALKNIIQKVKNPVEAKKIQKIDAEEMAHALLGHATDEQGLSNEQILLMIPEDVKTAFYKKYSEKTRNSWKGQTMGEIGDYLQTLLDKNSGKTQTEKVAEAIKEKPKTIKQIAEETKILEPNVRRILGVGAKEGTFERVEKGVYVLSKDGQDIAWVETGNAVESLPKLAKEGFKADMVFLDIPYDTPAVRGGNRGVKYNLVSVEDFAKVLDAVSEIAKTSNTPVIHMYSQAESGLKAMAKYNDLFIEKGFNPVGKGQYQKTFADGSPVTSPNGKVSRPEGILIFTKSGELSKDLKDLNFTLKRPKGYQTEKPAEMLKAMIEMTTEEGDMVLDPFAGSGVTGAEAIRAGRKAYLIETNPEVVEKITKPRVKEATKEKKLPSQRQEILDSYREAILPEYNQNPKIIKLDAFIDKIRKLDPKNEDDAKDIENGFNYEVVFSYPHSLGEMGNQTSLWVTGEPSINEIYDSIIETYKEEKQSINEPLVAGFVAKSARDENIEKAIDVVLENLKPKKKHVLPSKKPKPTDLESLNTEINKRIDKFRREAGIMASNEGAGTRLRRVEGQQGFEFMATDFSLNKAKADMKQRAAESKQYAHDVLYMNDEEYRKLVDKRNAIEDNDTTPFSVENLFMAKTEEDINQFLSNEEVRKELSNYFNDGELKINFVKKILMKDGGEAWGMYAGGMIEFANNPSSITPSHEAVHAFLDLFVTPEDKKAYSEKAVQEQIKIMGVEAVNRGIYRLWNQYKGKYSRERIRLLYGEEILANNFIDHVQGKNTKSFLAKLFDKIIYFLKSVSNSKSASKLYDDILSKKRDFVKASLVAQESYSRKEGAKSKNAQNIIGSDPIINLKRDVIVTDVYGKKSTIPTGEALTPYLMKGNKFLLKDGQEYIISKNQYQNVKANSVSGAVKEFAPELKQTEESTKGYQGKGETIQQSKKRLMEIERIFAREGLDIQQEMGGEIIILDKYSEFIELSDLEKKYPSLIPLSNEYEMRIRDLEDENVPAEAKYSSYVLPEGKNYKEILIQAPKAPAIKLEWTEEKNGDYNSSYGGKNFTITPEGKKFYVYQKDGQLGQTVDSLDKAKQIAENYAIGKIKTGFQSSHWSEPNVLAHIRLNEREYKGKKVTFLEEIQSDWAREARTKQSYGLWQAIDPNTGYVEAEWTNREDAQDFISRHPELELKTIEEKGFPTNPLLKNWQELSVKRALVEAVKNNSDYLSWTNGEQQSARYNLSKEVEKIEWGTSVIGGEKMFRIETKQGTVISGQIDNNGVIIKSTGADWKGKNIAEAIGKGIGEKIANEKQGELKGEGLNIGGTWAFNLYDKQIKNIVEDLTGSKVEVLDMGLPVDNKVPAFDLIQPSGKKITKLTPENLEVGAPVSNANGDYYVITDILGGGKFKAVPKETWNKAEKIKEFDISILKEKGTQGYGGAERRAEIEKIKKEPIAEYLNRTSNFVKEFDISQKITQQQAIKITPEIKALVKGEAPVLKQPSGEEVFMPKEPEGLGMIEKVNPIEMPELVKLARELTGEAPRIRAKMRNKLGYFRGNGEGEIYLKADQFVRGNEVQVAKTLAHEIGHLVDWIPDKTLKRGNLLGRIYSLRKFMGSTFNKEVAEKLDLDKIRNEAFKEILAQEGVKYSEFVTSMSTRERLKPLIKLRYGEKIDETGSIRNETIKEELTKVTETWRPYDKESSSPAYLKYRKKPQEIYADAISMLFNSPETLKEMAPTFYTEFFAALDRKPLVKAEYFELMKLLGGSTEEIFKARKEDIRKGFIKAEELQSEFANEKKLAKTNFWQTMRQQIDDINYPITKKQQEAEAKGKIFAEEESPRFLLQEESYTDNDNFLLVDDIDKNIVKPLEETGMIIDDLGEYLMLDRIQKDRADIANPFGFNTKTAAEQMEFLRQSVGENNFNLLKEKAKYFHDLVFKSVEEAVSVGSYNKELFETKIKPNKDSYASFQVVDYMQDYMPATIKAQVGTLKEVANPFVSTILKTIALNRLNAHQRSKNATVKMLKEDFPEDITETRRITSDGKLSIFKPAKDRGAIELLEDGKMQSYDVDPYIAESFKHGKSGDMFAVVSLIDKFNNKLFKPIVTTYNLGFAAAFNPIRDFKRNYKAIPNASVLNLLTAYVKSLPSAIRYSKGEMDSFTKSLVESKAINAPINDYNYDPREDELGRILERYGLVKTYQPMTNKVVEGIRKTILRPVAMVLEGMRFTANTFEIVSKVAGAKVRMAGGEEGKQLAYNLRNFTGTPNWKVKGKITNTTNALFVFSNIMKEGIKSDLIIASDPKTRSGYWFKTVKMDILPKLLMFMASAGLLGELLKGFFDDVSEYDKTNYIIIPLGRTNGKTVYVRIPHDETGRLVSSTFWKMANFVKEGGHVKDLQDIVSIGAGQLPSLSPVVEIGGNWLQYSMGKNPYDSFRGRNIIDDTTFAAGGSESLKKMVEWTTNSMGLTRFATYDTSKNTGLETFMQVAPWFSNVVKISNYGQQEQLKEISTKIKSEEAQQILKDREVIAKYVNKARADKSTLLAATKYRKDLITEALGGHLPKTQEEIKYAETLMTKFKRSLKRGLNEDPRVDAIISSTSSKQKVEILKTIQADMTEKEFNDFKNGLLQDQIVTAELLFQLRNK